MLGGTGGCEGVGIYWDFENVHGALVDQRDGQGAYGACKRDPQERLVSVRPVAEFARRLGDVLVHRVYADWSALSCYREEMLESSVSTVQVFPAWGVKNGADILMALDALRDAHQVPALSCFVIVAGDSDYIGLAQHLRQLGRRVVGIAPRAARSRWWPRACHEFHRYEDLLLNLGRMSVATSPCAGGAEAPPPATPPATPPAPAESAPPLAPGAAPESAPAPAPADVAPAAPAPAAPEAPPLPPTLLAILRGEAGAAGWVGKSLLMNRLRHTPGSAPLSRQELTALLKDHPAVEMRQGPHDNEYRLRQTAAPAVRPAAPPPPAPPVDARASRALRQAGLEPWPAGRPHLLEALVACFGPAGSLRVDAWRLAKALEARLAGLQLTGIDRRWSDVERALERLGLLIRTGERLTLAPGQTAATLAVAVDRESVRVLRAAGALPADPVTTSQLLYGDASQRALIERLYFESAGKEDAAARTPDGADDATRDEVRAGAAADAAPRCPVHARALGPVRSPDGAALHVCDECGGVFADANEVGRLLRQHGRPALNAHGGRVDALAPARACPADGGAMLRMRPTHGGAGYDHCPSCGGLWLEAGVPPRPPPGFAGAAVLDFLDSFRAGTDAAAAAPKEDGRTRAAGS